MTVPSIIIAGLVATGAMSGTHWLSARLGFVRGSLVNTVGSFVIPEGLRSPAVAAALHLLTGIGFAFVYAFIFSFLSLESVGRYIEIGGLVGFVHGFLVSYFTVMGFSGYEEEEETERSASRAHGGVTAVCAAMNVVSHLAYGIVVGLGFGFAQMTGNVWYFAGYAILLGAALFGILALMLRRPGVRVGGTETFGSSATPPVRP